jgi:hypothetical protein
MGRPRSTWTGKLGSFVSAFTIDRLAGELDVDPASVYGWLRGDFHPKIEKAIAIVEIARAAGTALSLENVYEIEVERVRVRMRAYSLPSL